MKPLMTIALTFGLIIVIVAVLTVVPFGKWAGGCAYDQIEYHLTFKDSDGNPLECVELRVEDARGNNFFCFPVTDYLPGHIPVSDKNGLLQFHHVISGVEWDIWGHSTISGQEVTTIGSPEYLCRFLRRGAEVHRVAYSKLPAWLGQGWEQGPKVKRKWNWAEMTPTEIVPRPAETGEHYNSRLRQFFHVDGRHREGPIAAHNACRAFDRRIDIVQQGKEPVEELEFTVIERTIIVDAHRRK